MCTVSGPAGDPKRLLHHLGLGFWSFLAEPTAGLLQVSTDGSEPAAWAQASSGHPRFAHEIVRPHAYADDEQALL